MAQIAIHQKGDFTLFDAIMMRPDILAILEVIHRMLAYDVQNNIEFRSNNLLTCATLKQIGTVQFVMAENVFKMEEEFEMRRKIWIN